MSTTNLLYAVYLAATPGTSNTTGRIIYTVKVFTNEAIMADFCSKLMEKFDEHLQPFFTSTDINEVMESLPTDLTTNDQQLIKSRWPFFHLACSYVMPNLYYGFPPCNLIKTAVQVLYNSLKGGLDANSQQCQSIMPPIRAGSDQKYVMRSVIAIVTNSWRALQILQQQLDNGMSFSMSSYRKLLVNNCLSLKDFNYNLAMALINSSNDPYFQNVLVAQNNRIQARQVQQERLGPVDALGVQQNLDTLAECIRGEKWPRKYRFRQFTTNKNLLEV